MIIPDINLLLYSYDAGSPFHRAAARWWSDSVSGTEQVGLAHCAIFGFVRIGTNPRVFDQPMTIAEAVGHVRSWIDCPAVQLLDPGPSHVREVLQLLEHIGTTGNLVTDAQLAAMAIEYRAVLHTADWDFLRFPGLAWLNPLTGIGSSHTKGPQKRRSN